jgi:hypothetical protein
MAAGLTTYDQISARVNDLIMDSLAVARMGNYLLPTVTSLSATGMMDRKVNEYNAVTFAAAGEDDDTGAQQFTKDALSTLTPASYRARVDITDPRAESDFDMEMANAALELGSASAKHVDDKIASLFSSATGGTVGAAGTVITWAHITAAYAVLNNQGIPAAAPVFCALHPYQWEPLLAANTIAGAQVAVAPGFQDRMTSAPNFFSVPRFQGVTFVISNSITIDSGIDAYGCMYVPQAFAVDSRKAFNVRPERDESRELTELNASMWYAYGVWRPQFSVAILSDAATPNVS